ncbi:ATP-binding cassette domain-containing protein [Flavobacterium sp. TP390]|uniref:ATP-binding cassette domain-containing protein n=1 Tax=Flavobacterium profundi TaxID=1774945 RepID=A0A6I4IVD0_9FLAO|nr:ABC transporter ATP-binding protein [Flavobacterium profundi]MVO10790.1 ATP-binding cassette domain-containing protein [Flavobacterium profundi]
MNIKQTYLNIKSVIPANKRLKIKHFIYKSILFAFLDLISISLLIPVITLLFNPEKIKELDVKYFAFNLDISSLQVQLFLGSLLVFYLAKIILQTKFNTSLYIFFYNLATEITIESTNNFVFQSYTKHQYLNKGKIIQDINTIPEDFSCKFLLSFVNLLTETIVMSAILIILLIAYFKLTLIAVFVLFLLATLMYLNKKKQLNLINSIYQESQAKSNSELLNILNGYLEIRNSGNYAVFLERFKKEKKILNEVTGKLISFNSNYSKYLEFALIISLVLFTLINIDNKDTIILLTIFGTSSLRLIPSISKILNAITLIKTYRYSLDILLNDEKKNVINNRKMHYARQFELKNISFDYDGNSILENINLKIGKGSFIGIKGDSGIGKTTLLYIILGIIKPKKGNCFIDNIKIENYDFLPFANYVPQQPFLFNGTILENIVLGQKANEVDYNYIYYLCRKLDLHDIIEKMEQRYETEIILESSRLSGGQKQRLALVRALYTKPSLLILDEATNQQDKHLEKKIFTFLKELNQKENLTIVAVSHDNDNDIYYKNIYKIENKNLTLL